MHMHCDEVCGRGEGEERERRKIQGHMWRICGKKARRITPSRLAVMASATMGHLRDGGCDAGLMDEQTYGVTYAIRDVVGAVRFPGTTEVNCAPTSAIKGRAAGHADRRTLRTVEASGVERCVTEARWGIQERLAVLRGRYQFEVSNCTRGGTYRIDRTPARAIWSGAINA